MHLLTAAAFCGGSIEKLAAGLSYSVVYLAVSASQDKIQPAVYAWSHCVVYGHSFSILKPGGYFMYHRV